MQQEFLLKPPRNLFSIVVMFTFLTIPSMLLLSTAIKTAQPSALHWILFIVSLIIYFKVLFNFIKSNNVPRHIVLTSNSITLPTKNNSEPKEIIFSNIVDYELNSSHGATAFVLIHTDNNKKKRTAIFKDRLDNSKQFDFICNYIHNMIGHKTMAVQKKIKKHIEATTTLKGKTKSNLLTLIPATLLILYAIYGLIAGKLYIINPKHPIDQKILIDGNYVINASIFLIAIAIFLISDFIFSFTKYKNNKILENIFSYSVLIAGFAIMMYGVFNK